jgi:ABC-type amino acid transport substrate-binding protein
MQQGSPEAGDFRGYEVDLLEALAQRLGVALGYRRTFWSAIISDLTAGLLDAVCSAATVTAKRSQEVDFCNPHLVLSLAIVTRAGDATRARLLGRRVGVRRGTTAEAYARQHGAPEPAILSESNDRLYAALAAGAIDAVVDDSPIAAHFAQVLNGLQLAATLPGTEATYAIMVRKGNTRLRIAVNEVLAALERDGTLRASRLRWGLAAL